MPVTPRAATLFAAAVLAALIGADATASPSGTPTGSPGSGVFRVNAAHGTTICDNGAFRSIVTIEACAAAARQLGLWSTAQNVTSGDYMTELPPGCMWNADREVNSSFPGVWFNSHSEGGSGMVDQLDGRMICTRRDSTAAPAPTSSAPSAAPAVTTAATVAQTTTSPTTAPTSQSPTNSPTADPTRLPTTSQPADVRATWSPTISSGPSANITSDPTQSPSQPPTTSDPTQPPTTSDHPEPAVRTDTRTPVTPSPIPAEAETAIVDTGVDDGSADGGGVPVGVVAGVVGAVAVAAVGGLLLHRKRSDTMRSRRQQDPGMGNFSHAAPPPVNERAATTATRALPIAPDSGGGGVVETRLGGGGGSRVLPLARKGSTYDGFGSSSGTDEPLRTPHFTANRAAGLGRKPSVYGGFSDADSGTDAAESGQYEECGANVTVTVRQAYGSLTLSGGRSPPQDTAYDVLGGDGLDRVVYSQIEEEASYAEPLTADSHVAEEPRYAEPLTASSWVARPPSDGGGGCGGGGGERPVYSVPLPAATTGGSRSSDSGSTAMINSEDDGQGPGRVVYNRGASPELNDCAEAPGAGPDAGNRAQRPHYAVPSKAAAIAGMGESSWPEPDYAIPRALNLNAGGVMPSNTDSSA